MKLAILDSKQEANATCYLCKVDLISYIQSIPNNYKDFEVQRGIVTNRYLDHLAETVSKKKHIPPIVLIATEFKKSPDNKYLEVKKHEILDGLQRTHRLKVIWDVLEYVAGHSGKDEIAKNPGAFSRANSTSLRARGGDTKLVRSLVDMGAFSLKKPADFFRGNDLWLELWTGLSDAEQVEKMLLLNAGHKSVNIKHQLELLFLSTLLRLEKISPQGVTFIREKDLSAIQYSKSRSLGQYHFSHIISALIALSAGRVVNTNSTFISDLQSNKTDYVDLLEDFSLEFMRDFIQFIFSLDKELQSKYQDVGTKWLGREVVLIGFFAAIGEFAEETSKSVRTILHNFESELPKIVKYLNLSDFEKERNNVELNKVNIGNANKRAVYRATRALLRNEEFTGWKSYFGGEL